MGTPYSFFSAPFGRIQVYKHVKLMAAAHLFPGHAIDEPMEEDLAEVRSMRLKAW